jgi:hypothetical protein
MNRLLTLFLWALSLMSLTAERPAIILVIGAPGTEAYGKQFQAWATQWEKAAVKGGATIRAIGEWKRQEPSGPTKTKLRQIIENQPRKSPHPLWIVLIGHGTYDGKTARFNLAGPDLSADELDAWLKDFKRPLAILNCAAASAPFLPALSNPNRVVLTATRSGFEANFCRLGAYLPNALLDPAADLDKDQQVSLLEAFLTAAHRTAEFYKNEGRLATEHALIDDNADTRGTPADWFRGIRVTKETEDGTLPDGLRAHQLHLILNEAEQKLPANIRAQRNTLELKIAQLRTQKKLLGEEEYFQKLEPLLLQLAKLYEAKQDNPNR